MKIKFFYVALIIAFIADLFFVWQEETEQRFFTKTILIPLLMLIYFSESKFINKIFVSGLVFSFLGDLFLLFNWGFLPGLGSFLLAHVLYIICFSKLSRKKPSVLLIFVLFIYLIGLLYILFPHLNEMKIPVIIYGIVITTMLYFSVKTQNKYLIFGALLFVISDSLLAVNLFINETKILSLLVMITYVLAQFLLVKGILNENKSREIYN